MITRFKGLFLTIFAIALLESCTGSCNDTFLFCYPDLQQLFEQYLDLSEEVFEYYEKGNSLMRPPCSITIQEVTRDNHTDTIVDLWRFLKKSSWMTPEGDVIPERGAAFQKKTICTVTYLPQDTIDMKSLINEEILQPTDSLYNSISSDQQEREFFIEYLTRIAFIIHRPNPICVDRSYMQRNHNEYYDIDYRDGKAQLVRYSR